MLSEKGNPVVPGGRFGPLRRAALVACLAAAGGLAGGCDLLGRLWPGRQRQDPFYVEPTPILQKQAYGEAGTGRFVSLTDFEDSPLAATPGYGQVEQFRIEPPVGGRLKYVVNITRTGVGAMEVRLPPGAVLVYRLPGIHDLSAYTLLTLAVHSRHIRDDLKIRLTTERAGWESPPVLLKAGWNDVIVDLQRLKRMRDFDARGVRSVRLWFSAASGGGATTRPAEAVRINIDDVLLIDNRREITPTPLGMRLFKSGLDYELQLPSRSAPIRVRQCDDGLWRLGPDQTQVELAPAGPAGWGGKGVREDLSALGRRRVGEVEVLEANAVRLRLGNVWYFPASAGQWESLAVRQIRWEYTFYGDGRRVTDVVVNTAGGTEVSALRLRAPEAARWSNGFRGQVLTVKDFSASVGRWSFLLTGASDRKSLYEANYAKPAGLEVRMGQQERADADVEADGFDESQGCYCLRAQSGHCRFLLRPKSEGMADPVFRVRGAWKASVTANSEGLPIRGLVKASDGVFLLVLPGVLRRPRWVELAGPVRLPGGR